LVCIRAEKVSGTRRDGRTELQVLIEFLREGDTLVVTRIRAPWPRRSPSNWRSLHKLVSNSANTPSMSRNALPAAVPVSIGCSVALSLIPLAFSSCTLSWRSFTERARRSRLQGADADD
jgi:hypothetical protein